MAPAPETAPSPKSSPPPPPQKYPPPASPPPPKHNQSPPVHKPTKSSNHKPHHKSSDGANKGQQFNTTKKEYIIGLALAAFVFIALIICITCCKKKKRKKQKAAAFYNKMHPGGDYYKNQWQDSRSPRDHVIQFTRPEGMISTPVGVGGRWAASASQRSTTSGNFSPSTLLPPPKIPLPFNMSHISYDDLSTATNGFSQSNLLGQGGFGFVYKGVLTNGHEVAVKSLKSGSKQGEREFQAEVDIISRVHHRHLVSLVGYCIADARRMLVYEYVSNKTLDYHLHGKDCPVMKWETRIRIALGSAKGLAYLHEDCDPRIVHRDIKSSNILLDDNFEAKVADFGLAKLASREDTHISTRVMGTFGYLAPEYASSGKLTEKSDVFSFGVMLLELLTGRKPSDPICNQMEDTLVDWAGLLLARAMEDKNYDKLVDPRLEGKYDTNEVARMSASIAASIRHSAKRRPKMSQIVRALEGDGSLDTLHDALKPQRMESTLSHTTPDTPNSIVSDTKAYNDDMKKLMEMVKANNQE